MLQDCSDIIESILDSTLQMGATYQTGRQAIGVGVLTIGIMVGVGLMHSYLAFASVTRLHSDENSSLEVVALDQYAEVQIPSIVYHSVRPYRKQSALQDEFDITPELLESQIVYLKDHGYTPITYRALARFLDEGVPLPPKPVLLSFDDGWGNQYLYAYPILKKYSVSATFFVYTNAINKDKWMTWDQLRAMQAGGMEIAAHTKTHPLLTKEDDLKRLRHEIAGSKTDLDEEMGTTTVSFAYPFGAYNATTTRVVEEAGFRIGRGLNTGKEVSRVDRFEVPGELSNDLFKRFVEALGEGK